ncbi:MAG: response regulator [Nitrospirae bacterium]|nr:response regulator [Nitrospirota bacterium]
MEQANGSSILIIDDDASVLETTAVLLREHGYSVIACENAKDAIAKLRGNKVDVVLTDIRMPEASGIELLEEVRGINMDIPVILMSAYAELDIAISAMGKGAFDFIVKPYKSELLVHSVEMAVKHKKLIK